MSVVRRSTTGRLVPRFWRAGRRLHPYSSLKSYPKAWAISIALLTAAALVPVILGVFLDYRVIQRAVRGEHALRIERHASNARRTVAHFLEERLEALSFAAHSLGRRRLEAPEELQQVFENLRADFGGFSDLGLFDEGGRPVAYCGPFDSANRDYGEERWFKECRSQGAYVSNVYLGYRDVPHMVIAVKVAPDGVLRATLDLERLEEALAPYAPTERDDVFLINREGVVQTPSRHHGRVLERSDIAVPEPSPHTEVTLLGRADGEVSSMGYAYVRTRLTDTPFILVMTRDRSEMARFGTWLLSSRILFVGLTVLGLLVVVTLTLTFMFNSLYEAEVAKAHALGKVEDVNRLVSLGRLAAGVAHEINNPLAVIKESAGYIEDLLDARESPTRDGEFREQAEAISESVDRCAAISHQLLSFARPSDVRAGRVDLEFLIRNVLRFHAKEAEFRGISIATAVDEDARFIETDSGKLQQVILNLVMNAFDAMPGGGELRIEVGKKGSDAVRIAVVDTGHGIPAEAIKSIFEPFFTTKTEGAGTGLGLSITYGLVHRLGGRISVKSTEGAGTTFTVVLPTGGATGGEA